MPECQSLEAIYLRGRLQRIRAYALAFALELP